MKIRNSKVLMLIIGAFFMLLGTTEVFAATLTETPVEGWYWTRRGGGKEYMSAQWHLYNIDGKTTFCIEPGINITVHDYNGEVGWINSPYSDEINKKIQLYGYYGYDYPGHNTLRYRAAAQSLIWEATGGQIVEFWTEASGHGDFINLNKERNEIKRLAESHYNTPTFDSTLKNAVIGETTTFTDTKGVLSQFEVDSSDGSDVKISGNTLSVTPNKVGEVTITLKKKTYTNNPTTIFVGVDNKSQKMGYFGLDDPIKVKVKLNVVGGSLKINKRDLDTKLNTPQGDGKFEGAVYELLDENRNLVVELVIDKNASAETGKILSPNKKYILREKKASEGYLVDPTEYIVMVTNEELNIEMNVFEDVMEQRVDLYKVFANGETGIMTSEPNVTFSIHLKSTGEFYKNVTTGKDGKTSVVLPYGTWVFSQETTTANYEKVEDFEITIKENSSETITKIISNAEIAGKVKVIKVDSESKKVLVRDGIKFKIKNLDNNEYVCQNITYPTQSKVCVFETSGGAFITPYDLKNGNYQIEELENQTIEGYLWNSTPLKFSIGENSNFIYDKDFGVILEVMFENKEVKGEFDLTKLGEKFVVENDTFHYEEIKLDGVSYNLIANGNIYSGDGTLKYKDKEIIKSFKTKDGFYKLSGLYLGNYCLIETSTVGNHELDTKPYCFKLEYKDQYTEVVSYSITLKNYLGKGNFQLSKTDISTGEIIEGATIEVYTEDDKLIYRGVTSKDKEIYIENLEKGKTYKFKEVEAPEGYILNDEIHEFQILENGDIIKATLPNEAITGNFELIKVDKDTGEVVKGSLIEILDEDKNVVFKAYSDEFGKIYVEGLRYGKYSYREVEEPEGYILDSTEYFFEIKEQNEVIKVTLENEFKEIEIPNTSSNSYMLFVPVILLGTGIALIIVNKRKGRKK